MTTAKMHDDVVENSRYHVPSLVRALQILELIAGDPSALGVSEMAARLGIPKNSIFRIVTTLADYGYLNREPVLKLYSTSTKLLALGYAAVNESHLLEKALGPMRCLRDATQETVLLGVLSGGHGVVVEQLLSPQAVKVMVEIGHQFPLHTSAPGKVMVAHLPTAEMEEIVAQIDFMRYTNNTITDRTAYIQELERVREHGFAVDREEQVEGVNCIAAPIRNRRNEVIAAIWVTGPSARFKKASLETIRRVTIEQANVISGRIGWASAKSPD
ncbi:IclR family transcriptional regulator [Blastopirellula marina]|nr:IclR family transcriptional regulator [Blastopirellula marina]